MDLLPAQALTPTMQIPQALMQDKKGDGNNSDQTITWVDMNNPPATAGKSQQPRAGEGGCGGHKVQAAVVGWVTEETLSCLWFPPTWGVGAGASWPLL